MKTSTMFVLLCPKCGTPYVLRVAFVMTGQNAGGREWLYQPDCRHKLSTDAKFDGTASMATR